MDSSQEKSAAEQPASEFVTNQPVRDSLLRRITPHMFTSTPQMSSTSQLLDNGAAPGTNTAQAPRPSRLEGMKRHVSYQGRPAPQRLHSNVDFPEETLQNHENKLADFRRLVGIDSSPSYITTSGYSRAGDNVGIYSHVVRQEAACMKKYKRYSFLINASLGMQLIFSAALTALGAGDGPRSAVTAFGAINTVLAGILTFTKGSGLPNREKYYAGEWTKIRDHIEQREREFGRIGCQLNVDAELREIEIMYREVKQDVEANTPDGFTSVAAKRWPGNQQQQSQSQSQQQQQQMPRLEMMTPSGLESGFGSMSPRLSSQVPSHAPQPMPNIIDKLNSSLDPNSRASQALSKLSSLQAKYGDTILEKLHQLDQHHSGSSREIESENTNRAVHNTTPGPQNQAQSQVAAVSSLVSNEAEYLATAGAHAQIAGEAAARELAERSTAIGKETASHMHEEADKLVSVGRQAETAARNISSGVANELRGFFNHHEHESKSP